LEQSFLLFIIFPKGTNVLKEPKICMEIPWMLLLRQYEECKGELREDFFALAMLQHHRSFSCLKTNRGQKTADFLLDGKEMDGNDCSCILEVGGKGKGRSQFKGVTYDKKIVLFQSDVSDYEPGRRVPLHAPGFPP
jgi:predicted AAA+ superfamily ATPase